MKKRSAFLSIAAAVAALMTATAGNVQAKTYKVGYNVYVGFIPYQWMANQGVLAKWAKKYNVDIQVIQVNDYVGGLNQFAAGALDAMTGTAMDGLTIPSANGVDTTFAIAGDYSNGNDGVLSREVSSPKELKGKTINLVQFSVSHYMLSRALQMNGLTLRDVHLVNTSDSDVAPAWLGSADMKTAVTWNPMLLAMQQGSPGTKRIFDSSNIPEEVVDGVFFHTADIQKDPNFVKALTGAWYETMQVMNGHNAKSTEMVAALAGLSGGSSADFQRQIDSTHWYYEPRDADEFLRSARHKQTWDFIRSYAFDNGLFGQDAKSKDFVGIQFPDGTILGDKNNVKFRVNADFTRMAAEGKL